MGFRFQRRLNFDSGLGLNISKTGGSPSVRTKHGTIGAKGYSIRIGIPGLTLRKRYKKGSGEGAIVLAFMVAGWFIVATMQIAWFLIGLAYNVIMWLGFTNYDFFKYLSEKKTTTEEAS